jgi:hypothetical protein
MAIANSGAVSFTDIQTEFGGSNPIAIDEYYAGGAGAGGAVRIIWPGTSRSFPSTRTGNE